MDCKKYSIRLSGYVDNMLSTEDVKSVTAHLQTCLHCQRELQELQKLKKICGVCEMPVPSSEKWVEFDRQLLQKIRSERHTMREIPTGQRWRPFLQAAAVLLVVWIISLLFHSMPHDKYIISLRQAEGDIRRTDKNIVHTPVKVTAATPTYKDAAEIRGLSRSNFSPADKEFLLQNGFVVTEKQYPSFIALYRDNCKNQIPSFITVDFVISGLLHILTRLRVDLEQEVFLQKLTAFTTLLAQQLVVLHKEIPKEAEEGSLRAIAFVRVAQQLLNSNQVSWPQDIEAKIRPQVEEEFKLIYNGRQIETLGIQKSPIFHYDIDYRQFKVRWDEAKDDRLRRYYQTLDWYSRCIFRSSSPSETQSALLILMAAIGDSGEAITIWEEMYQVLAAIYGEPDDLHLLDYLRVARSVYGDTITPSMLTNQWLLQRFSRQLAKTRPPQICSEVALNSGLRIFGGRSYDRDLILQQLLYPYVGDDGDPRVTPSVGDLGVILNHPDAISIAREKDFQFAKYNEQIKRYQDRMDTLLIGSPWQKGGLVAQAWLYESLMRPEGKGYPSFSRSDAWRSRKLTSILCGILNLAEINSKPTFTGKSTETFSSTLDPYPEFFNRMVTIIRSLEELLNFTGYPLERPPAQELISYKRAIQGMVEVAQKKLGGGDLQEKEERLLANFALGWEGDYEEANINELSILFHRNDSEFDEYFYAGIEPIRELWVIWPGTQSPYLTRGGVYLLYEFSTQRKIVPEQWRKGQLWERVRAATSEGIVPWTKNYVPSMQH